MAKVAITVTRDQAKTILHALRIGIEDGSLTNNEPDRQADVEIIIERINHALHVWSSPTATTNN